MRLAIVLVVAGCAARDRLDAASLLGAERGPRLAPVSAVEREAYLARARVFDDGDPAARDPLAGPPDRYAFAVDAAASCDYLPPSPELPLPRGTTPKFFCTLRHHRQHALVKVKYGRADRETYGEVLGSRLLWMLGVAVDHDYPVRLRCHGCPRDPWAALRAYPRPDGGPRGLLTLDSAVIQRLAAAAPIEECTRVVAGACGARRLDQGWTFDELRRLRPDGAARAELDALVLLAAFIAHGDDKPSNQRLVCPFSAVADDGRCRAPRLLVADLGATFGRGASPLGLIDSASRPSFAAWSTLPLWRDPAACRVRLAARASQRDPIVSEAGRALLAARLARLDDRQIRALFVAARIERLGERVRDGAGERPVTVDDWARAFRERRRQLMEARCR